MDRVLKAYPRPAMNLLRPAELMDFTGWVILTLIAVIAFAFFLFTQETRMLGRLAVALGGENKSSILGGNYVKLNRPGGELQIRVMPSSSDSGYGSHLTILRKSSPAFRMQITASSWAARLGNAIGLVNGISVGDPTFDQRYRIKANNEEQAVAFVNDPQRREALAYFFDQGFTDLTLAENEVYLIKPQNFKSDLEPVEMKRYLEHFALLFPC